MALIDDFKAKFPDFDDAKVDLLFPSMEAEYKCYYNKDYGLVDCEDQAILNLLGHIFVIDSSDSDGARKNASSKSVVGVSISYEQGDPGRLNLFYNTTKYGQKFLQMTAPNMGGFFV